MKKKKITIILLFIFMLISTILYFNIGSDYFWHLKLGEYITKFKQLPTECIYSWFAIKNNLMFLPHEWLSQIIIYGFYHLSNTFAPIIYIGTFLTLLVFFIYKTTIKTLLNKDLTLFIPFIILSTINLSIYTQPRPHIISWLFIALTIYLSYDLYKNNSKKIYLLPIISLFWANIHGGSSCLAYLIPGLFLVVGLFNFNKWSVYNTKLSKEKIKIYILVIILIVVSLLINPYGFSMILYPYINIFDNTMTSIINEWHPLNIKRLTGFLGYLCIFYNLYIYYQSNRKIKLIDLLLFIIFTFLATSSYRFVPLFVIISFYTSINYLKEKNSNLENRILPIITIIIILFSLSLQFTKVNQKLNIQILDEKLISTIKEFKPKRLYNDYNIGGYLIYHEIDVFIDGRADAYSKTNLKDSYSLSVGDGKNTKDLLNKYDFDLLITENNCYLDKYLKKDNDYEFIIKDNKYSIYKKINEKEFN